MQDLLFVLIIHGVLNELSLFLNCMASSLLNLFRFIFSLGAKLPSKIFLRLLCFSRGYSLCFLFNLSALLRGKNVRFEYNSTDNSYKAKHMQLARKFYSSTQNTYSYYNGFKSRADDLAKTYFLDLIVFEPGDTIIDCGANVGDFQLYFYFKNIDIDYIAIEPSPLEFEALSCNLLGGQAINAGLFDKEALLDFYVSSEYADSSYIMPSKFNHVKKIKTHRLDELISKHVKLLKLEAEGAEPEVLMGSLNMLCKIDYITADLGFERGIASESTLPAVANFLICNGFRMIAVGRNRVTALFVRSELIKVSDLIVLD